MMAFAITLLLVRSHVVVGGPGGLVPVATPMKSGIRKAARDVDASECILEFKLDPGCCLDNINSLEVSVRQVFGQGEAASVQRALRGLGSAAQQCGGGSLRDVVISAVEVMRHVSSSA